MNKCIFLDRDGTINKEVNYLYKPEDFQWEDGAVEAIKIFKELGYLVVIVSNQSGIARGYYSEKDVEKLHSFVKNEIVAKGGDIDGFYFCPHHPGVPGDYGIDCSCRKPEIGMFIQAKADFDIDFEKSYMAGDKIIDVEAAVKIGAKPVLVRTGHGKKEEKKLAIQADIYDNLYEFACELSKNV